MGRNEEGEEGEEWKKVVEKEERSVDIKYIYILFDSSLQLSFSYSFFFSFSRLLWGRIEKEENKDVVDFVGSGGDGIGGIHNSRNT